jgi:hypothetical protein
VFNNIIKSISIEGADDRSRAGHLGGLLASSSPCGAIIARGVFIASGVSAPAGYAGTLSVGTLCGLKAS